MTTETLWIDIKGDSFEDIARGTLLLANRWIEMHPGVGMSYDVGRVGESISVCVSARPSIAELEAMLANG